MCMNMAHKIFLILLAFMIIGAHSRPLDSPFKGDFFPLVFKLEVTKLRNATITKRGEVKVLFLKTIGQ